MNKLTNEQYNYLSQFEDRMRCALHSNYCRNIQRNDLLTIKEIYESLIGTTYKMSMSCSTCMLNLMKRIAVPYFEYQNELANGTVTKESGETEKGRSTTRTNRRKKD
jgi:hypothetical protein